MYSYFKGVVTEIGTDYIVLECGGVGYKISAVSSVLNSAGLGDIKKVYVHQVVKEDEMYLCGFSDGDEKTMFLRLISVSGVGPKTALLMISSVGAQPIALAIVTGDTNALTKVAGVGKKTAQRLILELRGSIENNELVSGGATPAVQGDDAQEAITAVMALGYTRNEAQTAVNAVKDKANGVEDIIRMVLRGMDRG